MNETYSGVRRLTDGDGKPPYEASLAIHGLVRRTPVARCRTAEEAARAADAALWWMQDFSRKGVIASLNFAGEGDLKNLRKSEVPDLIANFRDNLIKAGVHNVYNHNNGFVPPKESYGWFPATRTPAMKPPGAKQKSDYVGVSFDPNRDEKKPWRVSLGIGTGKVVEVGRYENEIEAAKVSDNARWYLRGFRKVAPKVNFGDYGDQPIRDEVFVLVRKLVDEGLEGNFVHDEAKVKFPS